MNWIKQVMIIGLVFIVSGCATFKQGPMGADQTAQRFFDYLQTPNYQDAYALLGKGLQQRISYDKFDQFMQTLRDKWGRLDTDETQLMPFHQRVNDSGFIPLHVTNKQVRRYSFDVKFDDAEMNFDLTLAPVDGAYKIVFFTIWGSSIYMTPDVQAKIDRLFGGADDAAQ